MKILALMKHISTNYFFKFRYSVFLTKRKDFICCYKTNSLISLKNHDTFTWNTMITSYFKNGDINSAHKLFDEMPHRNVVTYNCMISGFCRNHMINEARKIFDVMPLKNVVSWTAMLSGYIGCGKLDEARSLFDRMPVNVKTHVCWDIMLKGYIKFGRINEARDLFDQCCDRNVGLCNRMLSGYVQMGCVEEAHELFSSMPDRDLVSWTSMLICYAKAGLMIEARTVFDDIPFEKDAQAWTAMIRGYMQNGVVAEGLNLFHVMPYQDTVAWNCVISGLVENGRLKEAIDLYERMPKRNIVSSNSILFGFVLDGDMINARKFFEDVMYRKDTASWNTLISGFQTEEALFLFSQMRRHEFMPDQTTYMTILSICGSLALHGWGKAIHSQTIKTGFVHDVLVSSSLMSMYSKCGLVNDATSLFKSMEYRDTVTWNTMIVAQAYHGSTDKALELYSSMIQSGCRPNHVTFLALLTACAHCGLVKEGQLYFKSMESEWGIIPRPEHYACMVDLFGRSGMLKEAYELVKQLPSDVPSYAWETLLNHCKLHGNNELGEIVSQKILKTKSSTADMNVLVSNIYAGKGLWDESENIRTAMRQQDLKKEKGSSWVEVGRIDL